MEQSPDTGPQVNPFGEQPSEPNEAELRLLQLQEIAKTVDEFRAIARELNGRSEIQTAIAITLSQLSGGLSALGQGMGLILREISALKARPPEPQRPSIIVP